MEVKIPSYLNENWNPPSGGSEKLVLDFVDHIYINSVGIANWIKWLENSSFNSVELKNVSHAFMKQASSISNMINVTCRISSFKIPIYSEVLGDEKEVLVSIDDIDIDSDGSLILNLDFGNVDEEWEIDCDPTILLDPVLRQLNSDI